MAREPTVVLLVPIVPAATGNGLAMRAGMLLDALTSVAAVHLVVVPVSGPITDTRWATERARSFAAIHPVGPSAARDHATQQLADPELRARLQRTAPLPPIAVMAPPTLASAVQRALPPGIEPPTAVLAMRLYLAPLGAQVAHSLGARRLVVDADDDDATLSRALSDSDDAFAFDRLARCWLPDADAVLAASPIDADAIAARAGLDALTVVPNTVPVPQTLPPAPGKDRLLFLGNLTYKPNMVAARLLGCEILPMLRRGRPGVTLDLVGPHDGSLDDLAGVTGVRLTGAVPDVAPHYAAADVVVVPLRHGSGTRIKVLEAFAHGRPVVATPTAVAGLDVEHGREALLAESPEEIVETVDGVLRDPAAVGAMVERARRLIATRYAPSLVAPLLRTAVLGPDA